VLKHDDVLVWEYHQPETDSRITLVGVTHAHTPHYYRQIQQLIEQREHAGAEVHYEGIRQPEGNVLAVLDPAERQLPKDFGDSIHRFTAAEHLPETHVTQGEHLAYADHWIRTDIDMLSLLRRLGHRHAKRCCRLTRYLHADPDAAGGLATLWYLLYLGWFSVVTGWRLPRILVRERNEIALAAVRVTQAESPHVNLVMIWGRGHLPGLHAGLTRLGFTRTQQNRLSGV
jgi:hypothetical protein